MDSNPRIAEPRRTPIRRMGAGFIALVLLAAALTGTVPKPARADGSDRQLITLTKTTIYGGLLGGLLGLTSALIVKEDSRDDVIRWGVAIGAVSGFAYGIFSIAHGNDDLSSLGPGETRLASHPIRAPQADTRDLVCGWRLGDRRTHPDEEVSHDGFEEEHGGLEAPGRLGQGFAFCQTR